MSSEQENKMRSRYLHDATFHAGIQRLAQAMNAEQVIRVLAAIDASDSRTLVGGFEPRHGLRAEADRCVRQPEALRRVRVNSSRRCYGCDDVINEGESAVRAGGPMTYYGEQCGCAEKLAAAPAQKPEGLTLQFACPLCGVTERKSEGAVVVGESYQCYECGTRLVFSVAAPELDAMHDEVAAAPAEREREARS